MKRNNPKRVRPKVNKAKAPKRIRIKGDGRMMITLTPARRTLVDERGLETSEELKALLEEIFAANPDTQLEDVYQFKLMGEGE